MPYTEIDKGYKIFYLDKGKGNILVLIHGFLGSSWLFEPQVEYFSRNYRVIAVDHLGHGKSDKPESEEYQLKDLAQFLENALQKIIGDQKIVLAGHSMGGMIALNYATDPNLSKRLRGLILMSTAPKLNNPGLDQYIESLNAGTISIKNYDTIKDVMVPLCFNRKYKKSNKEIIDEFIDLTLKNEEFVGIRTMNAIVNNYDVTDKLKDIDIPTLILTGDKDIFIPPNASDLMHEKIPNSQLIKFSPKIGHMIQFEARDDYQKAVEDFINNL
ncbi:MAG: alpha/beta hydrolase [Promethearchaeota archaeon]|nr:MAG: alpha/beta hydrolase [Candidatus Lokiarchaeota archaeon]